MTRADEAAPGLDGDAGPRRLRVAYVYRHFDDSGSLPIFYRDKAERLAADEDVTAFCSARDRLPTAAPLRFRSVESIVRGQGRLRYAIECASFAVRATRALMAAREHIDVIHVEGYAALTADLVTVHAVREAEIAAYFDRIEPAASSMRRRLTPWLLRPQSGVVMAVERALLRRRHPLCITPTRAIADDVARVHGVPPDLIEVIPYGVDCARFAHDPAARREVRHRLGVPPDRLAVLFVGHDFERKGLGHAIEGLAGARVTAELWVIGAGDTAPYRRLATRAGVGERVRFLGPREHAEMPAWLSAADALVLLSRQDAWGHTAMEAMAGGRVPVVSSHTGVSEVIQHGRTGFVLAGARPAEEFRALLDGPLGDAESRSRIGERGPAIAGTHDHAVLYPRFRAAHHRAYRRRARPLDESGSPGAGGGR